MHPTTSSRCDWLRLPLLLLVFASLSFFSATRESVTVDEFRHLSTGVYYWQTGDFSFDSATPPLWKLAFSLPAYLSGAEPTHGKIGESIYGGWTPWFVATDFMRKYDASYDSFLASARIVNILAACACLAYLYRRARQRFDPHAALYGTAFLAFSPTLLAHSHYATSDVIACLTLTVLTFQLIDFSRKPSWPLLWGVSFLLGLSLVCKFSAILLLPPFLVVIALRSPSLGVPFLRNREEAPRRTLGSLALPVLSLLLAAGIVLATINLQYGFGGFGTRLRSISLQSRSLQSLSATPLGSLPLPLPRAFIEGFDHQKADSDYAEFPSYFMGRWAPEGFRYYYLAAFSLKETIPFVVLFLVVLFVRAANRDFRPGRSEALLLWFVPASLLFVLSFMNKLDVGVRYLLPAYPFLCYFFCRLFADRATGKRFRAFLLALLALHCLSTLRVAPHFTAYFNELCGGPGNGYRYLIDSNLDWGQDLVGLKRFMEKNRIDSIQLAYFGHALPEHYGIKYVPLLDRPKPGYVAVSATLLQGQPYLLTYLTPPYVAPMDHYYFMRKFEPIAQVGHSIMIYRIV
jgi:hypothetical protein